MGVVMNLIDVILFIFLSLILIAVSIIYAQTIFPIHLFPDPFIYLKNRYIREYDDYLLVDKPNFFVGIVWLEIFYQWPLAIASLYGIAAGKSWFPITSFIYGISALTLMVAILAELRGSNKASDKLLMYYPSLGLSVLAILRGLLPNSSTTKSIGKRPLITRKKRA